MLIYVSERQPALLKFISDKYKTKDIGAKDVEVKGLILCFVPDQDKMQASRKKSHRRKHMVIDICP